MHGILGLGIWIRGLLLGRASAATEILALRQQLAVLRRIPCRCLATVGEVGIYLSAKYSSMNAKYAATPQPVRSVLMPMRVGED